MSARKPARVAFGLALGLALVSLAVFWLIPRHGEAPAADELHEAPPQIAVAPLPAAPERAQQQGFEISTPPVPAATAVPVQEEGGLTLRWADPLPSRGVAEGLQASLAWMPCREGDRVRPATHPAYLATPCWSGPAADRLIWTGDVPPGDVEWRVSHLDFEVARGRFVQEVSSGEVVLDASGWPSLVVSIRDAAGKVPPLAKVTLGVSRGEVYKSCSMECDAGEAVFAPLSPQCVYSLSVESNGFSTFYSSDFVFAPGAHRQRIEAVLQWPASVAGRVLDDADKPVAACEVKLRSSRNEQSETTDEEGRFHFEGATVGPARVWVKSADRPQASRTIVLERDTPPLLLRLPKAAWLDGTLVDSAGVPMGHEPVFGEQEKVDESEQSSSRVAGADEDGHFHLGPFAEGRSIWISHPSTGAAMKVDPGQEATLRVPKSTWTDFELHVRDMSGQPLPGVVETEIVAGLLHTGTGKGTVKADGLLRLKGLVVEGQPTSVRLQKNGFEDFVLEIPASGTEALTCTLVARGTDPFRVVCQEASGPPVEGAALRLRRDERQGDLHPGDVWTIPTDGVGRPNQRQRVAITDKDGVASLRIGEWPATAIVATAPGFYPTVTDLPVVPVEPVRIVLRPVDF